MNSSVASKPNQSFEADGFAAAQLQRYAFQETRMLTKELNGIFLSVHGDGAKYAVRRKIDESHERYDVFHVPYKIYVVRNLVKLLDSEFDDFLPKFCSVEKADFKMDNHRTRHYISTDVNSLFPSTDDTFRKNNSYRYKDYWIGTNINAKTIVHYVRLMCEACGVQFGAWSDLKL